MIGTLAMTSPIVKRESREVTYGKMYEYCTVYSLVRRPIVGTDQS